MLADVIIVGEIAEAIQQHGDTTGIHDGSVTGGISEERTESPSTVPLDVGVHRPATHRFDNRNASVETVNFVHEVGMAERGLTEKMHTTRLEQHILGESAHGADDRFDTNILEAIGGFGGPQIHTAGTLRLHERTIRAGSHTFGNDLSGVGLVAEDFGGAGVIDDGNTGQKAVSRVGTGGPAVGGLLTKIVELINLREFCEK